MTVAIGSDIARFGNDMTGVVVTEDIQIVSMEEWAHRNLMETTGRIIKITESFPDCVLTVDDTGLGGGVVDRLAELGVDVLPVNYSQKAYELDRFRDKASEMWWRLREIHDPDGEEPSIYPPRHPLTRRLMAQLSGARYKFDSRGRIWVMKQEDGTESPDLGDAYALALEGWVTFHASSHISDKGEGPSAMKVEEVYERFHRYASR